MGERNDRFKLQAWEKTAEIYFQSNGLPDIIHCHSILNGGVLVVRQYRPRLLELYGYDIGINPRSLGTLSSRLQREERYEQAIEIRRFQVELSPDSPYLHEGLARTYEASGQLELALRSFETARDLARADSASDLGRFDDHILRVRKRVSE